MLKSLTLDTQIFFLSRLSSVSVAHIAPNFYRILIFILGGFDGTSNVLAGKLFNIPVKGTHAHAYITSFSGFSELKTRNIKHKNTGALRDLLELAIGHRAALSQTMEISTEESSEGELAAMVSFAIAFPDGFMALVDTYDVKRYFAF